MKTKTLYAIHDAYADRFFPEVKKSYTRVSVDDKWCSYAPRLFPAEGAAKAALTWWLRGEHYQDTEYVHGEFGVGHYESAGPTAPTITEVRDPDRFEVVTVEMGYGPDSVGAPALKRRIERLEYHIDECAGGLAEFIAMPCISLQQRLAQIIRRAKHMRDK